MSVAVATDLQHVVEDAAARLYVWALKDIPRELQCHVEHADTHMSLNPVAEDAHGNSLYHDVQTRAHQKLEELYDRL
jgi:hypothetical protein